MVAATAADVQNLAHVEVRMADASAPGLATSSYDLVASCLVLFFLPDPAAALRAWFELLVPGGRLGVATFGPQVPPVGRGGPVVHALSAAMLDARASGRRGPFASDEGMESLLIDAAFVDVRTAHLTVEARFAAPDQWHAFSWSHGQRAMWEAVPPEQHEGLRRQAASLLDGFREAHGAMSFTQKVRYTLGRRPV